MSFICNALNFLNEENKRFLNCLFLSLYLIFFLSFLALSLIFFNEKNKRFTNYLSLYFSFNLLKLKKIILIMKAIGKLINETIFVIMLCQHLGLI
jgi:hypothetical protein